MTISRRTALKAALAALMAPTINLRPHVDRESLLRRFVLPYESLRYDLEEPFQFGSLTYATDTRWMVRTELVSPEITGERRLPNVADMWREAWQPVGEFVPFELPPPEALTIYAVEYGHCATCPYCGDRRVSYGPSYPPFGKDGQVSLRLQDLDWDIDDNTHRDPSCEHCNGLPFRGPSEIEVAGVLHDYWRMRTIAAIPGLRVSQSGRDADCLLFRGDGFEGVAMGLYRGLYVGKRGDT